MEENKYFQYSPLAFPMVKALWCSLCDLLGTGGMRAFSFNLQVNYVSPSLGIVNVNHTDLLKNSCIFGNNQKVFCEMLEVMGFSLPLERLKDCFLQDVFKRIADFNSQHPIWLPLTVNSRILAT